MKKISFFFLFLISNFVLLAQDVKLSHNLPASMSPGETFDVQVNMEKHNIGSFAKFQCDLPVGFSAANIDSKTGNFTFENQRVKIVWVSVPSEPTFDFKFKINVPPNALNTCVFVLKFYYLENNVKKEFEAPAHNVKITKGAEVATTNTVTTTPTNTVDTSPTNTVTTTPTNTVSTTPTNTVTTTPTNTVDTSPTNTVTTTPTNTVDTSPTNTVTTTPTNTVDTTPTNTVTTTPTNTVTTTPTNTVDTTPTNTVTTTTTNSVTTTTNSVTTTSTNTVKTNNTTSGKEGVIYKIQVGAFAASPSKSKFSGISVSISQEGGMFKALSGTFKTIDEAQKHKAALVSKGFPGFIVAYQNGARVKL